MSNKGQVVSVKSPKQACNNCGLRCVEKIYENGRKILCEEFWKFADINKQRDYICRFVDKLDVKRPRVELSRRKHSSVYKLPYNGHTHRICKVFFLNTLCITEKKLRIAIAKRGKHEPHNKTSPERILHMEAHIDSFPRVPAH